MTSMGPELVLIGQTMLLEPELVLVLIVHMMQLVLLIGHMTSMGPELVLIGQTTLLEPELVLLIDHMMTLGPGLLLIDLMTSCQQLVQTHSLMVE
jgi:hypothetical protein